MVQSTDQQGEASQATRKVADAIALGLVNGKSVEEVAGELVKQGWKQADAVEFVRKIDEVRQQAQARREARSTIKRGLLIHLIMGLIWITIGVMLMVSATPQRDYSAMGVAVIALGAIEAGWSGQQLRKATIR